MIRQSALLRSLRRATLLLALLGAAYLVLRFDLVNLPDGSCSPLRRYEAGDRLIVDRRPASVEVGEGSWLRSDLGQVGDAVLVRDGAGTLHLALISAERDSDGALWCSSDCDRCEGFDSGRDGWIPRSSVAGRILLAWVY